jgi:hypothetical protein
MSKVAFHESQAMNGRKFLNYINLRRKHGPKNFCKKPENVAFRSMLTLRREGSAVPSSARGIDGGPRRSWGVECGVWGERIAASRQ